MGVDRETDPEGPRERLGGRQEERAEYQAPRHDVPEGPPAQRDVRFRLSLPPAPRNPSRLDQRQDDRHHEACRGDVPGYPETEQAALAPQDLEKQAEAPHLLEGHHGQDDARGVHHQEADRGQRARPVLPEPSRDHWGFRPRIDQGFTAAKSIENHATASSRASAEPVAACGERDQA